MRRMLRDMAERGILAGDRRGIAAPDTLPEVAVLELIDFDDNGDGMARQAGNEDENQPEIRVILSRRAGRAPAVGQQVLARLARVGPALYEARIIRVLDRPQKRLFCLRVITYMFMANTDTAIKAIAFHTVIQRHLIKIKRPGTFFCLPEHVPTYLC